MFEVVNRLCGELPDRFRVQLFMENGAAWVVLEDVILDTETTIDSTDKTLEQQLIEALELANSYP